MFVSVITPTRNRSKFLSYAGECLAKQTDTDFEWLICDDGSDVYKIESSFDFDVIYDHVDIPLSVGAKRNRLIEMSKGDVIVHFDDDDYYAPNYIETMVNYLDDRNFVNLQGWYVFDLRNNFFGYCDTQYKSAEQYALEQDQVRYGRFNPQSNEDHLGFGFGFAYRKSAWEYNRFDDVNWNEDGTFSAKIPSRIGIINSVGLCLHIIHPNSSSRCYPQYRLPQFLVGTMFPEQRLVV